MQVFKLKLFAAAALVPLLTVVTNVQAVECLLQCFKPEVGGTCDPQDRYAYRFDLQAKGPTKNKAGMKNHYYGEHGLIKSSLDVWNNRWYDLSVVSINGKDPVSPNDWVLRLTLKSDFGPEAFVFLPSSIFLL